MSMEWLGIQFEQSSVPGDTERAKIIADMLADRGQDIVLPRTDDAVPNRYPRFKDPSPRGKRYDEIIGAIAAFPESQPLTRTAICDMTGAKPPTVTAVTKKLMQDGLIEESSKVSRTPGQLGAAQKTLATTALFAAEVAANPDWRRAAKVQAIAFATHEPIGSIEADMETRLDERIEQIMIEDCTEDIPPMIQALILPDER